jgi:acyl-CoA thioester hydrolase
MSHHTDIVTKTSAQPDSNFVADPYRTRWGTPVRFISKHRARFAEIDPFGHMNTNHYVAYFTENRFIGHRDCLNLDLKALSRFPIAPHIRKIEIDFIRPVFADVEFVVESFLSELAESSCVVLATMKTLDEVLLATCTFLIMCVDKTTFKQTSWPDNFISMFYEQS